MDALQAILGQLHIHAAWKRQVIAVLTGETDATLERELRRAIDKLNKSDFLLFGYSSRFHMITKA